MELRACGPARGRRRRRRAFTLVEALITIGILVLLVGLLLPALGRTRVSVQVAQAEAQLRWLVIQLQAYHGDHGAYPRTARRGPAPADLLQDDAPALWAGLRNAPVPALGGGAGAPYGAWEGDVGVVRDRAVLAWDRLGMDGVGGCERLDPGVVLGLHAPEVQSSHAPRGPSPLVFLDPWGNPWHYREWEQVAPDALAALRAAPPQRSGFTAPGTHGGQAPIAGPGPDLPRNPLRFDLWSSGPNGVNELGARGSDDVGPWTLSRQES